MREWEGEPSRDVRGGFSREIWVTIQQIEREDNSRQREHYPNSRRDLKGSRNYKGRLA